MSRRADVMLSPLNDADHVQLEYRPTRSLTLLSLIAAHPFFPRRRTTLPRE